MEEVLSILNNGFFQFSVIFGICCLVAWKLGGKFLSERYAYHKTKEKELNKRSSDLRTFSGQLKLALDNPDVAYSTLMKDINECKKMEEQFKDNKQMASVWEQKRKGHEWKLNLVTKMMEHKEKIDFVGTDTIVGIVDTVESKIRKFAKSTGGGLIG